MTTKQVLKIFQPFIHYQHLYWEAGYVEHMENTGQDTDFDKVKTVVKIHTHVYLVQNCKKVKHSFSINRDDCYKHNITFIHSFIHLIVSLSIRWL